MPENGGHSSRYYELWAAQEEPEATVDSPAADSDSKPAADAAPKPKAKAKAKTKAKPAAAK